MAYKSCLDGFFTMRPLLVVTGRLSLLWLEGTGDIRLDIQATLDE